MVTQQLENLSTLSHYFSEPKNLSLDSFAMQAKCFMNNFPKKLYMLKCIEEGQLDER